MCRLVSARLTPRLHQAPTADVANRSVAARRTETHSSSLIQGSQPTGAPLVACERNRSASVAADSLVSMHFDAFGNDPAESFVPYPRIFDKRYLFKYLCTVFRQNRKRFRPHIGLIYKTYKTTYYYDSGFVP